MKPNIANFTTPTGQHGNLFQPSSWLPLIIGTGVLLITFATGQKLVSAVHNKIPALSTDPQAPFASRVVAPAASQKRIWQ